MKNKKTITAKALAANRANSKKSTGPHNTTRTKLNALKHGFLAHSIRFKNDREREQYQGLLTDLLSENSPQNSIQRIVIEEIALTTWKLRMTGGLDLRELMNRRRAAGAVIHALKEEDLGEHSPLLGDHWAQSSAAQRGWDCSELSLCHDSTNTGPNGTLGSEEGQKLARHLKLEMKVTSSLDTILRYHGIIKRDLFRAIKTLHEIQSRKGEL